MTTCSQKITCWKIHLLAFSDAPVMKGFPGRNVTDFTTQKQSLGASVFPALLLGIS